MRFHKSNGCRVLCCSLLSSRQHPLFFRAHAALSQTYLKVIHADVDAVIKRCWLMGNQLRTISLIHVYIFRASNVTQLYKHTDFCDETIKVIIKTLNQSPEIIICLSPSPHSPLHPLSPLPVRDYYTQPSRLPSHLPSIIRQISLMICDSPSPLLSPQVCDDLPWSQPHLQGPAVD